MIGRGRHGFFVANLAVALALLVVGDAFMGAVTASVLRGVDAMSTETIIVGDPQNGFVNARGGTGLTRDTLAAMRAALGRRFAVTGAARSFGPVAAGRRTEDASAYYVENDFFDVTRVKRGAGRMFSGYEAAAREDVCLLSDALHERLEAPARVGVDGGECRVIGRVASDEVIPGQSIELAVYRPLSAAPAGPGGDDLSNIFLRGSGEPSEADLLAIRELIPPGGPTDDMVWSGDAYWTARRRVTDGLGLLVTAVSAMLTGMAAAGLANSLSLDVMARRSEIGLRVALGATRRSIFLMFLREGLAVATAGGLAGLVAGLIATRWGVAPMLDASGLIDGASPRADLPTIGWALTVLVLASLGAALVPARRAVRTDPALALRGL